jgi:hypothetical protein
MITPRIEADILDGKAVYQTKQFGFGGQNILKVGAGESIVIFGYEYNAAGAGFGFVERAAPSASGLRAIPVEIRTLMTQQVSFYTGSGFFPFVHHVPMQMSEQTSLTDVPTGAVTEVATTYSIVPNIVYRDTYIPADRNVAISVGLLTTATRNTAGAMPATGILTPTLTYGGSGQIQNVQTDISGALLQYLQPGIPEFNNFGFGLIPANASDQSFGVPAAAGGLEDPTRHLTTIGAAARDIWASNYLITIHYAVYNNISSVQF